MISTIPSSITARSSGKPSAICCSKPPLRRSSCSARCYPVAAGDGENLEFIGFEPGDCNLVRARDRRARCYRRSHGQAPATDAAGAIVLLGYHRQAGTTENPARAESCRPGSRRSRPSMARVRNGLRWNRFTSKSFPRPNWTTCRPPTPARPTKAVTPPSSTRPHIWPASAAAWKKTRS